MARDPLKWLGGLLVVYLAAPVAFFLLRFAGAPQRGFHIAGLFPSLVISLSCATASLALSCVFGIPLAFALGRSKSYLARAAEIVVTLPLALPPVMGGIILVYLVGPYSYIGSHLGRHLTNSVAGIIIAMTFCSAPFLVLSARAAFATLDPALLDVAATLGHRGLSRFVRVAIPVAGPEIRAGMTMTWLRAFGEYGAVTVLAYNPASLPIYTVNEFMAKGIAPTLAPTMLALIVAGLVALLSQVRTPRLDHVHHTLLDVSAPEAPHLPRSARLRFDVAQQLGTFHLNVQHDAHYDNIAVLGPSGSGKSVLLRSLAGIYGPVPGYVDFGDDDVNQRRPEERRVGYVAQGFSLFPHLTVWRNLMFPTNARPDDGRFWLRRLHLEGLEDLYPSQLSGGQRQRVALAQALCHSPEILLLDEPFSALDMPVRRELQRELRRLQRETGLSTVVVTHDPEEAAFLAQEIMVIEGGRLLQSGTTREVFSRPASRDVARLLGVSNLHSAIVTDDGLAGPGGTLIDVVPIAVANGTSVWWTIRPECIGVHPEGGGPPSDTAMTVVSGTLTDYADVGVAVEVVISIDEQLELHARLPDVLELDVGDRCTVTMRPSDITVWEKSHTAEVANHEYPRTHAAGPPHGTPHTVRTPNQN